MRLLSVLLSCVVISFAVSVSPCPAESRVLAPSTDEYRRNGEGSLLTVNNGRLLLVYTQWYSGTGSDHDPARLVEVLSRDQGQTWSAPRTIQENVGKMDVMSASLVRAASWKILLTYIRIERSQRRGIREGIVLLRDDDTLERHDSHGILGSRGVEVSEDPTCHRLGRVILRGVLSAYWTVGLVCKGHSDDEIRKIIGANYRRLAQRVLDKQPWGSLM